MWNYEKRLQYPVNITQTNPQIAQVIISQFGGPDGELSASMRYLSQRYTIPYREVAGLLTDIGTEVSEMFHFRGLSPFVLLVKILTVGKSLQMRLQPHNSIEREATLNIPQYGPCH